MDSLKMKNRYTTQEKIKKKKKEKKKIKRAELAKVGTTWGK